MRLRLGAVFIFVPTYALARQLKKLLGNDEQERIVGVGNGGYNFASWINNVCPVIEVETVRFDVDRSRRELSVGDFNLDYKPVLVDDVAVSGQTLGSVVKSLDVSAETVAVGLLYKSKTTRKRIGVNDIRAGLTYCREGGGNPPINSYTTLRKVPERLEELAEKYFDGADGKFVERLGWLYSGYDDA